MAAVQQHQGGQEEPGYQEERRIQSWLSWLLLCSSDSGCRLLLVSALALRCGWGLQLSQQNRCAELFSRTTDTRHFGR